MKLITKLKNWWKPFGFEKIVVVDGYAFAPKEDITAYELYICKQPISFAYKNAEDYKWAIDEWYNSLPEPCKRHLMPQKIKVSEICHYID